MQNYKFIRTLTMLLSIVLFVNLQGQSSVSADSTKVYKVVLQDGSAFIGKVLQQDTVQVVMQTSMFPRIEIPWAKIKVLEEVDASGFKKGRYWFKNPHASRYLFGPSAFNLQEGEGYYQNTWIFLNSFNVGITNYFSIGGGIEFLSTFTSLTQGEFKPIYFITPKFSIPVNDRFRVGAGVWYIHVPEAGAGGIGYGIATYGNTDDNITVGAGWLISEWGSERKPVITLSGMKRLSPKIGLISENWFIPVDGYTSIWSYGIRFFGEKMAIDLAFINNSSIVDYLFIGIPYVDFVVKF